MHPEANKKVENSLQIKQQLNAHLKKDYNQNFNVFHIELKTSVKIKEQQISLNIYYKASQIQFYQNTVVN